MNKNIKKSEAEKLSKHEKSKLAEKDDLIHALKIACRALKSAEKRQQKLYDRNDKIMEEINDLEDKAEMEVAELGNDFDHIWDKLVKLGVSEDLLKKITK